MGEKLSRGARVHNRREKSAARSDHRMPNLLRPTTYMEKSPLVVLQPELPQSTSLSSPITESNPLARHPVERIAFVRTSPPSMEEIMTAGSTLAITYRRDFMNTSDDGWKYASDRGAVVILNGLKEGIETGKVTSEEEIARQVNRVGSKIGFLGSASTEIDFAALGVLDAIKANKDRLTGKLFS